MREARGAGARELWTRRDGSEVGPCRRPRCEAVDFISGDGSVHVHKAVQVRSRAARDRGVGDNVGRSIKCWVDAWIATRLRWPWESTCINKRVGAIQRSKGVRIDSVHLRHPSDNDDIGGVDDCHHHGIARRKH